MSAVSRRQPNHIKVPSQSGSTARNVGASATRQAGAAQQGGATQKAGGAEQSGAAGALLAGEAARVKDEFKALASDPKASREMAVALGGKASEPPADTAVRAKAVSEEAGRLNPQVEVAETEGQAKPGARNVLPGHVNAAYDPKSNTILVRDGVAAKGGEVLKGALREEYGEALGSAVQAKTGETFKGDVGARAKSVIEGRTGAEAIAGNANDTSVTAQATVGGAQRVVNAQDTVVDGPPPSTVTTSYGTGADYERVVPLSFVQRHTSDFEHALSTVGTTVSRLTDITVEDDGTVTKMEFDPQFGGPSRPELTQLDRERTERYEWRRTYASDTVQNGGPNLQKRVLTTTEKTMKSEVNQQQTTASTTITNEQGETSKISYSGKIGEFGRDQSTEETTKFVSTSGAEVQYQGTATAQTESTASDSNMVDIPGYSNMRFERWERFRVTEQTTAVTGSFVDPNRSRHPNAFNWRMRPNEHRRGNVVHTVAYQPTGEVVNRTNTWPIGTVRPVMGADAEPGPEGRPPGRPNPPQDPQPSPPTPAPAPAPAP